MVKKILITKVFFLLAAFLLRGQSFQQVTFSTGIIHQYYEGEYGGGVCFVDFDKDGWDDITFCQNGQNAKFYRNVEGLFQQQAYINLQGMEMKNINWVDYDDDGDLDIFVTYLDAPFKLFKNNGSMQFIDVTTLSGFPNTNYRTFGSSWGDYDRDGFLDVYISNYNGPGQGDPTIQNLLYHNNGDGTFSNTTAFAGVGNGNNYTFMSLWIDYDKDIWPDLFVINDRYTSENYLYHNNGNGTFTDVSYQAGVGGYFIFSMSDTGGDYDNDGDLDIYMTNGIAGNVMHRNNGDGTFTDASEETNTVLNQFTWCAQMADYDNDTWQDMHICGIPFVDSDGQNVFLKNMGDGTFANTTEAANMINDIGFTYCSAVGDYNNDGYPDIALSKKNPGYSVLWKNIPQENNWMKVKLLGTESNREGVSSWIEAYVDNRQFTRYTFCGEAYLSQASYTEMIGLGDYQLVDSLIVRWPSGIVDTWYNIPVNQSLSLLEGSGFKVEIEPSSPIFLCEGNTVELSGNEWPSYLWSTGETTPTIVSDSAGWHVLRITDAHGNIFQSDTLQISLIPFLETVESITHISCYGFADGNVLVENNTAEPLENVIWNEGELSGALITELNSGIYHYQATDLHGCSVSDSVQIFEPPMLIANATTTAVSCYNGQDGAVEIIVEGGTPDYYIDWNNSDSINVSAGQYFVEVMDENNCIAVVPFEVTEPPLLTVNVFATDQFENGELGTALAEIQGGVEPYSIVWSNEVSVSDSITDLLSGFYYVVVTDSNQCTDTTFFEIDWILDTTESISVPMQIFPNPAQNELHCNFTDQIPASLVVIDAAGKKIKVISCSQKHITIDISELPNGNYYIANEAGVRLGVFVRD
jgi:ASPIC and UnbV/FG-GAP-like repeat/Secretion system C-terminal sorting domain